MSFQNCKIVGVGVEPENYHKRSALKGSREFVMSSSSIRAFGFCPRKWLYSKEDEGTRSTDYGQLLETLILLPHTFKDRYVIRPETYKSTVLKCPSCGSVTESKTCRTCKTDRVETTIEKPWTGQSETCQQWIKDAESEGLRVIEKDGSDKYPGLQQAIDAQSRLTRDQIISSYIKSSDVQVHVKGDWKDDMSGLIVPCQCLIDLAPRENFTRTLGDFKTARSAYPAFWRDQSRSLGYNVQAAWNLAMWNAAHAKRAGEDGYRNTFCFIISENSHPWETGLEMMVESEIGDDTTEKLDYGRIIFESYMSWYCECLGRNHFPGYDEGQESVDGWSVDRADGRDDAAAMRAMTHKPQLVEPEEEYVSDFPS